MKISVCIPIYNSSDTIEKLINEIILELKQFDHEVVLVNDGSLDNTGQMCEKIASNDKNIKYIELTKNFGEHNAVMCALAHCTGDCAVIMDDDFQNPPCEIHKLINKASEAEVIYSRYNSKKHHLFRNIGSKFNWLVSNLLLDKPNDLYLSSFKLINRPVIDSLLQYRGPFPYIDGLILRSTDSIEVVAVNHAERNEGSSNYTFFKLISLWLNMFINFSIKPLRIVAASGVIIMITSFMLSFWVFYIKITENQIPSGWASIMILLLFLFGLLFLFLGIIGEYLGKQYLDQNGTPQWIVRKIV